MESTVIKSDILNEEYYEINHSSGLKIFVMPKNDYKGAYAIFGTKYGSIDNCFKTGIDEKEIKVPEGIAHFLEHKLFESEELDAFARFEKTGASANAFTSFDKTCYLFSCTDNFEKSLEILLDFVKSPYFSQQTVDKEQGIIAQEIKMYQDNPDWQVLFNMLKGMYHNHSVKIDIAGTVDSIEKIDAQLLYTCYNAFYTNSNMALAVVGNVSVDKVLDIADSVLIKEDEACTKRIVQDEPESVVEKYTEQTMGVDTPKFALGFKESYTDEKISAKQTVIHNILLDIIAGKVSSLYEELLEKELINTSFSNEYFCSRGFCASIFTGESHNCEQVRDFIFKRIQTLKAEGISDEAFEISRKRLYGLHVRSFNQIDDIARNIIDRYFCGDNLFALAEEYKTISREDVQKALNELDSEKSCLSVIK